MAEIASLTAISFNDLENAVKKWLLIEDQGVIKLLCAAVVANKLPASPFWLFLVAPAGGGETDLIKALRYVEGIYPLSSLTPQTFLSGLRGKDTSLLPQINNNILTFKDFTTILQSHPQAQSEIFSQLREIYDGYYKKDFGTGGRKEWEGKLGFIAGVTSIIDRQHNVHKSLGERFLQYRIEQPDRKEVLKRVKDNSLKKREMDEEIATAFGVYFRDFEIPEKIPEVPEDIDNKLKEIANFVSIARSSVIRNYYKGDIEFVPDFEMSTRIYNQIHVLAIALTIINKEPKLSEIDFKILFKLGFDSIHYLRRKVLETVRKYKGWIKTDTLATGISYTTKVAREYLEDLSVLGIVEVRKPHKNLFIWRLKPEYREAWRKCEWAASSSDETLED